MCPQKPEFSFHWRLTRDIIPIVRRLQQKGIDVGGSCNLCSSCEETCQHIFLDCPFMIGTARDLLQALPWTNDHNERILEIVKAKTLVSLTISERTHSWDMVGTGKLSSWGQIGTIYMHKYWVKIYKFS